MFMKNDMKHAAIKQLSKKLESYETLSELTPPSSGWVHAIRSTLGMTLQQLANRLSISSPAVLKMEKNEAGDATTLKTLRAAADALDCQLVYALIPKQPLSELIQERAEALAKKRLEPVFHTMALEEQSVSDELKQEHLELEIKDILENLPKELWDKL